MSALVPRTRMGPRDSKENWMDGNLLKELPLLALIPGGALWALNSMAMQQEMTSTVVRDDLRNLLDAQGRIRTSRPNPPANEYLTDLAAGIAAGLPMLPLPPR
eukprot:Skav222754  [mRNA]  locus=scaffold600:8916:9905:- [translate_table: standard]